MLKWSEDCTEIEEDGKRLKSELTLSRNELRQAINEIKNDAIREINGASLETIGDIISAQLGVQNNQVTFMSSKTNCLLKLSNVVKLTPIM